MNQRLGRPAEDEFKLLCSQAQITCNKSVEDDHGWDFIIETTPRADPRLPADKQPTPSKVSVQVRHTENRTPRTKLKVSNALKFAKSTLPCFLVLFHEPTGGEKKIYARHLFRDFMEHALRRGRKLTETGKQANKAKLTVKFEASDDHTDDLTNWIVRTVEELQPDYGEAKRLLSNSLGYEGHPMRAEIMLGPSGGIEDIVDHQLGLKDHLPVSKFKLVDTRFGVDTDVPGWEAGSGRLMLEVNNKYPLNVVLRTSGAETISLPANVIFPVVPELPPDKFKVVVETWMFRLIMSSEGINALELGGFWSERIEIERLLELSTLVSWAGRPVTIKLVGERMPTGAFSAKLGINSAVELYRELSSCAATVKRVAYQAGVSNVKVSLRDMYGSLAALSLFHHVLTNRDMRLAAECDPEWKRQITVTRFSSCVDCTVGEYSFVVVFDMAVNDRSVEAGQVDFDCGEREFVDCFVGDDADRVKSAALASLNDRKANCGSDHLLVEDFRSFIGR